VHSWLTLRTVDIKTAGLTPIVKGMIHQAIDNRW